MPQVWHVVAVVLPLVVWCVWWLLAVNWQRAWPVLAAGGWVPAVLLVVMASLAWSMIAPSDCGCLGVTLGNGWWQLGVVVGLALLALFCGWLQGQFGWAPHEVSLDPPPPAAHEHH